MNLLHIKYAVEVADCGSINRAAEKLFVSQPNLSRAIKELETTVGITIFDRSTKGMFLTPDGDIFIRYAKNILGQLETMEALFKKGQEGRMSFSVSVPRASYISAAFACFSEKIDSKKEAELYYKETNSMRTLKNIMQEDYKLGIVRYAVNYERYYNTMMEEKGLTAETITEFNYVLIANKDSKLANSDRITFADLADCTEIAHADPYVPSQSFAEVRKEELPDNSKRRIFVFERASQFELLSRNNDCFMWVSPVPKELLDRYGLVQRVCPENKRLYRDVLIYKNGYTLSKFDKMFIKELNFSKCRVMGNATFK